MASLGQRFNAEDHDTTQRDFTPVPDGDYVLEVSQSEVAPTSNGKGVVMKLVYSVIAPEEFKGRNIYDNINIEHSTARAQEIGREHLAALCRALELPAIEDSDELHFKQFAARIGMGKDSKERNEDGTGPKYPGRPEVKRYYFPDEGALPEAKVAATAPPAAANDNTPAACPAANDNTPADHRRDGARGGARPWARRA